MDNWELLLRLLIAAICGYIIGSERKNRSKEAGVRTHIIIAVGSCLIMMISKYGFADLPVSEAVRSDPARLAAQVVSGIGFLCAGMILVKKQTISGLTTAAGMWTTSGIGLAIGAGMYVIGIATSLCLVLVQVFFHLSFTNPQFHEADSVIIEFEKSELEYLMDFCEKLHINPIDMKITKLPRDVMECEFQISIQSKEQKKALIKLLENEKITRVEINEE